MAQRSQLTRRSFVALGSCAALALISRPAIGQTSPRSLLARLFTDPPKSEWFTPDFLGVVPITQVRAIIDGAKTSLGAFNDVSYVGGAYFANFANGRVPIFEQVNDSDQFVALFFYPPLPKSASESSADPDAVLQSIWTQSPPSAASFTDDFIHLVPIAQITAVLASMRSQGGTFQRIETTRGTHFAVYDRARFPLFVYIDGSGKIANLVAFPPQATS
jgi:hypothetical protein